MALTHWPAQADTFTVTRTNISGAGSLLSTINQVNATPGNHIVEFGVSGTLVLDPALPAITNNVVIKGDHRITLSGGGRLPILTVGSNVTVGISGLSLVNGYTTNGAAAINNAGNLTIQDCVISGHRGGTNGGAVYNAGHLTIQNSIIQDNQGSTYGGAVHNAASGYLELVQVTLSNNIADPGWGGGVYSLGTLSVSESTLVGNISRGQSGQPGDPNAYAGGSGGGGGGAGFGGGLFIELGSAAITNTTFSGNQVIGGAGGSVFFHAGLSSGGGGPFGGAINRDGGFGSGGGSVPWFEQGPGGNGGFGGGAGGGTRKGGDGGSGMGGAVFVKLGTVGLVNCTLCLNSSIVGSAGTNYTGDPAAPGKAYSAGLENYQGQVSLLNTIVAGNIAADGSPDLGGIFNSQGNNLIGNNVGASGLTFDDYQNEPAGLGPLQNNDGPTPTHALLPGSTAIDNGKLQGAPSQDQRGIARPQGTQVDIGGL